MTERVVRYVGAQVFEVKNGKVFWTSGKRIAAVFNCLRNNIRRETGYRIIKWIHMDLPPDNPAGRVAGMGDTRGELFRKKLLLLRDLEEKMMG